VNFNLKELEAFLDFHIEKAISRAIATLEKQYATANQKEAWLTRKEVIAILGISMPTLSAWSKDGTIPGYRIGGLVRYKRSEIDEAFKQMRTIKSRRW
jgi:excisionase family DNA binding protein